MKILVTGRAGLIGRPLVKKLIEMRNICLKKY
jgi:nucleoside-diphosphate-sugar epimerase